MTINLDAKINNTSTTIEPRLNQSESLELVAFVDENSSYLKSFLCYFDL